MKIVINTCFGGFGLSEAAYEKLIEWGIPVQKHIRQERDEKTGLYKTQPLNDGEIIFDRDLTPPEEDSFSAFYWKYRGKSQINNRYWDCWTHGSRTHPLILRVVEELGAKASGDCSDLKIIEIPDDVDYEIDEYDGEETVHEVHRSWS